jgi:pilus assembly protein CpaE
LYSLAQSGSADWVSDSAPLQEILDIVARQRGGGSPAPSAAAPRRPDVVSFLPSAGGVGNSTLATETALQLVRAKGGARRKVCLVDLDVQTSHVCDYLDIKPQLQIDELVRAPQRLDSHLLEMFCSRHDSGLHVFAAPRSRLRHVELNVEALDAFFERLAQSYDVIVVDLPVEWRPWTVHVLAASQGVLVTGLNVIPGLRQISETLAAIRSEPAIRGRVLVIVNRCEIGALGRVARRQHVDAVLGAEEKLFIRASRVVEECANTGAPMAIAYPSHKIVKEIAAIAKFCESVAARHGVKK